jgi:hypothetical protein
MIGSDNIPSLQALLKLPDERLRKSIRLYMLLSWSPSMFGECCNAKPCEFDRHKARRNVSFGAQRWDRVSAPRLHMPGPVAADRLLNTCCSMRAAQWVRLNVAE